MERGVDEEEPAEEQRAEDGVEAEGLSGRWRRSAARAREASAIPARKAVAWRWWKRWRASRFGVEGVGEELAGVEEAVGGVEHPDGEEHGERGRRRGGGGGRRGR